MKYCLGTDFDSLTQRVLYAYPAAYPKFVPVECPVSIEAQKDMHEFMEKSLIKFYETPEYFEFPIFPDEYFGPWQLANQNPVLMQKMEKIEARFVEIITMLLRLGKAGQVTEEGYVVLRKSFKMTRGALGVLQLLSIKIDTVDMNYVFNHEEYPKIFEALVEYAKEDNERATKVDRAINFIYAKYYGRVYSAENFFHNFLEDASAIHEMEELYAQKGYTCGNSLLNGKTRYACTKWQKEYKNGQKSSFSIYFNPRVKDQLKIEFHLPDFRKALLENYDSLDSDLKAFVFSRLKTCDACGYCTQMDKSGQKKRLAEKMISDGTELMKCPLYPNFSFNKLDPEEMQFMKKLVAITEQNM